MDFDELKENTLSRPDKSKKGSWDEKIIPLCNVINQTNDFFTSSSCAGRVVLFEMQGPKKNQAEWLKVTHDLADFEEFKDVLSKYSGDFRVEFKQQSAIIHIGARTLEQAQNMVELGLRNGFKRSGIISSRKKFIVELLCTEMMSVPVYDGTKLIEDEYLRYLVEEANQKMHISWNAIDRLKEAVELILKKDKVFGVNQAYLAKRSQQVEAIMEILKDHVKFEGETMISLGCGVAPELQLLNDKFERKIGVDHHASIIDFCTHAHQPDVELHCKNHISFLTKMPNNSVDLMFALDIDTNMFLMTLVQEALPKLKAGGTLILSERDENKRIYGRRLLLPYREQIETAYSKHFKVNSYHLEDRDRDNFIITITKK